MTVHAGSDKEDTSGGTNSDDKGWREENGESYWYENGIKQGTTGRGKEIFDPSTDAWYWLDAVSGGQVAKNKEVYMDSGAGVYADNPDGTGKWVRYDADGHMVKGWYTNENGTYYYDTWSGAMAKGTIVLEKAGKKTAHEFNTETGIKTGEFEVADDFKMFGWNEIGGVPYWFEEGVKQGVFGRGKETYDPDTDAWYWLDSVDGGKKAVSKDVYQESGAGPWGEKEGADGERYGKWVRYDKDGYMIKGWSAGTGEEAVRINSPDEGNVRPVYYFDTTYGTMAKGTVKIDGKTYKFDEKSGVLIESGLSAEDIEDEKPADEGKDEKPADEGKDEKPVNEGKDEKPTDEGKDKDTTEEDTNKNETAEEALAKIAKAKIGDIVTFGSYEQDNNYENGAERIRWYVLDKKDGQATLLSVKIIEAARYHFNSDYVSWKTCGLRGWLNGDFYKEAFTAKEQNAIATTLITNSDNPVYPSTLDGDGDTEDKVWLLSLEEVSKYFNIPMSPDVVEEYKLTNPNNYSKKSYEYAIYCYNQDNRILAKPTTYALDRHNAEIWTEEDTEYYKEGYGLDFSYANGAGWWWLRSPGRYHNEAAAVNFNGEVHYYGFLNYFGYAGDEEKGTSASGAWRGGIRPAVNVKYE